MLLRAEDHGSPDFPPVRFPFRKQTSDHPTHPLPELYDGAKVATITSKGAQFLFRIRPYRQGGRSTVVRNESQILSCGFRESHGSRTCCDDADEYGIESRSPR